MKAVVILQSSVLALLLSGCQHTTNKRITNDDIQLQTDSIFAQLVKIRRDLHAHPELAGNETRTASKIADHLRGIGLEVQIGQYGNSVIGILRGAYPGKTVAWRAELDALANDFPDPATFKSQTAGVNHGCGHDVHIAIALGIAEIAVKRRKTLHGTLVFIFQPEEETFVGAKALIDRGAFASNKLDEIYGLHVTALPVGHIVVRPNEMFAHQRRVSIKFKSALTQAQTQELTQRVQSLLVRARPNAKPWDIQNVSDPAIGLSSPSTDFQDYLIMDQEFDARDENGEFFLEADLYETNVSNIDRIIAQIEGVIEASGHKHILLSVSFVQGNPTVLNDENLTRLAIDTLRQTGDTNSVILSYGQAPFFNDDFAYFQQKTPGVYFFLGGSNLEKGLVAMNHAPNFQVDEESIRVGVSRFASLIIARLDGVERLPSN